MQPLDPGFVRIFNPETQGTAVVPETSLAQHYRAGWAPLDESAEPEAEPDPVPDPVRAPRGAKKPAAASEDGGSTDDSTGNEG